MRWMLIFSLPVIFLSACNSSEKNSKSELGEIDFSAHCNKEAKPFFEKGLLLLHSFEYDDAAENFIKAEQLDSTCVMAFWGEAMTYNHPLWRYQEYEKGKAALNKLGDTPEERAGKSKVDLETDFLRALDQLYGKGTKAERDSAYAAWMRMMYGKYPRNDEVTAFYSLSLLGSVEVGRNDSVYEYAAELAKEVLTRNPNHPGALHYLIHSYDDPKHASLAIDAADKYAVVAPAAGHALHMPSHIYLAMGMWDKVVASNEASWAATVIRKENKHLKNDALGYHSLQWLQYGYLQQGRMDEARKLLDNMKVYCDTLPSGRARAHLTFLKTTYMVETNDWTSSVTAIHPDLNDANISTKAMEYFVEGMSAYKQNNIKSLGEIISGLDEKRMVEAQKATATTTSSCMSINATAANLLDVQQAEVMELELQALQSLMKDDTSSANKYFMQATSLESSLSYSFGPPVIIKPSNEMYAEWLFDSGKPEEALKQFQLSLKEAPNRIFSLKGALKAAEILGDQQTVTEVKNKLNEISAKGMEMKNSKQGSSRRELK